MNDDSFFQILEKSLNNFFITAHFNINTEGPRGKSYYKIFAEPECMYIMNSYFGYNFQVCSKVNQKAIDGYCNRNNIGIQVTNRTDKAKKFRDDTISIAGKLKEYPQLVKLKFFILQYGGWDTYKGWSDLNKSIKNGDDFDFNINDDIITFDTIVKDITTETNIERIKKFMNTLIDLFPKEDWISDYNGLIKNSEMQKIEINNIIDGISTNNELEL